MTPLVRLHTCTGDQVMAYELLLTEANKVTTPGSACLALLGVALLQACLRAWPALKRKLTSCWRS